MTDIPWGRQQLECSPWGGRGQAAVLTGCVGCYRPGPAVQRQNTVDENPANPLGQGYNAPDDALIGCGCVPGTETVAVKLARSRIRPRLSETARIGGRTIGTGGDSCS